MVFAPTQARHTGAVVDSVGLAGKRCCSHAPRLELLRRWLSRHQRSEGCSTACASVSASASPGLSVSLRHGNGGSGLLLNSALASARVSLTQLPIPHPLAGDGASLAPSSRRWLRGWGAWTS